MCGTAGIIIKSDNHAIDLTKHLARMNDAMPHRGPDDDGCFVSADQQKKYSDL